MKLPATLLARTALTLAVSLLILFLFSMAVIIYYVTGPMARQAAEDAAALMVLSAQTWAELPPDTRADFENELELNHGITLTVSEKPLQESGQWRPHMKLLKNALESRLYGVPVRMGFDKGDDDLFVIEFEMADRNIRLTIPRNRIAPRLPFALLWLATGGLLVLMVTSLIMVRRLTLPLERLSRAVTRFGQGEQIPVLEEEGPQELKALTHSFNEMMQQIRALLANRTTLLAGISHDLRTPIARMALAIELLPQDVETDLLQRMRHDLAEMDKLITRTLQLTRSLDDASRDREHLDLHEFTESVLSEYHNGRLRLETSGPECKVFASSVALKRVLVNLIDNALRYGGEGPVDIQLRCNLAAVSIEIADRGAGIPEDQLNQVFQPFFRLERSRNADTGGSGLGLAIVQQLCQANGWEVSLHPREGGGLLAKLTIQRSKGSAGERDGAASPLLSHQEPGGSTK